MTDPNVIKAMNLLSAAVCSLATKGLSHKPSDAQHAIDLADEASELLAAAEKPAEAAPVVTGGIQFDPQGHAISPTTGKPTHIDPDGWFGFANKERAGVYVKASGLESSRRAVRAMRDAGIAAVRGEAAPVATTLPWVVRRKADESVVAAFGTRTIALDWLAERADPELLEVAAAPTVAAVAAVEFNKSGDACGDGWVAESFALESPCRVSVSIDLRPGEDAGETVAKMLTACGRGL